jgi:hypothetical protein
MRERHGSLGAAPKEGCFKVFSRPQGSAAKSGMTLANGRERSAETDEGSMRERRFLMAIRHREVQNREFAWENRSMNHRGARTSRRRPVAGRRGALLTVALFFFSNTLVSGCGGASSGGTSCPNLAETCASASPFVWTDSIQSGSSPYGFDEFLTERPIDHVVTPSDANGVNLSRVPDPLGGPGYAIRQYGEFDSGGARAELGIWSFQNEAFRELALSGAPVYVAQEWYFPEAIDANGDEWPWLSFLDWHTTAAQGEARWNTSPGIVVNEDGSMTFEFNWGSGPGEFNGQGSGWSQIGMPVGEWFDIEMRWQFATGPTARLAAWVNGVLAVEQVDVVTALPEHSAVELYIKHYGDDQGRTPWNPSKTIKYVRNVRISGARIWR